MTAPALAAAPACTHRRVREHGAPRLAKGPPPTGDHDRTAAGPPRGFHIVQAATCLDCGWPVMRCSEHLALGPWETVAGGTPGPRVRRHGERYG